jgi:DNA modification methylase
MTNTKHTIILGDSRDMSILNNNTIHLIVTSPPYWQLKDYGNEFIENQKDIDFDKAIQKLPYVFKDSNIFEKLNL